MIWHDQAWRSTEIFQCQHLGIDPVICGLADCRKRLKESGINDSWATLRKTLQVQQRVTTSMSTSDGRMIHVRKSTKAEPLLMQIYQTLGIDAVPGSTKKLVV